MRRHKKGVQSSRNLAGQTGTGATATAGGMSGVTARAGNVQAGFGQKQGAFNNNAKQDPRNGQGIFAKAQEGARAQTGNNNNLPMTRAQAAQAKAQSGQAGANPMGKRKGKSRLGKGKLMNQLPAVKGMRSQQAQMQPQV